MYYTCLPYVSGRCSSVPSTRKLVAHPQHFSQVFFLHVLLYNLACRTSSNYRVPSCVYNDPLYPLYSLSMLWNHKLKVSVCISLFSKMCYFILPYNTCAIRCVLTAGSTNFFISSKPWPLSLLSAFSSVVLIKMIFLERHILFYFHHKQNWTK